MRGILGGPPNPTSGRKWNNHYYHPIPSCSPSPVSDNGDDTVPDSQNSPRSTAVSVNLEPILTLRIEQIGDPVEHGGYGLFEMVVDDIVEFLLKSGGT